jgi:hypothetical protein
MAVGKPEKGRSGQPGQLFIGMTCFGPSPQLASWHCANVNDRAGSIAATLPLLTGEF